MEIRILRPGDEALLIAAVALTDEGPIDEAAAAAHLADRDLVAVAALEDGLVAGFVYGHVLRRFEATSFFIYSVDVAEAFRRRGIARSILATLRDLGRSGRWDEMFVFTNASNGAAMALYADAGGVQPEPGDVVLFDFCG